MKLTFLGATGTVTGSKYLLSSGSRQILVDCGLFQGLKQLRLRNWGALPVNPKEISAVVLTHAHVDHTGYLLLVKLPESTAHTQPGIFVKSCCRILLICRKKKPTTPINVGFPSTLQPCPFILRRTRAGRSGSLFQWILIKQSIWERVCL